MHLRKRIILPGTRGIRQRAIAGHGFLKEAIKNKIPLNEQELGRTIENKINTSQRIMNNMTLALFSQKSLENVSHFSSYTSGILMILLTDLIVIFPLNRRALIFEVLLNKFILVFLGIILMNMLSYITIWLLGARIKFKTFFSTVNTAVFMSIIIFSIPLALITFALFSTMVQSQEAIRMLFGLIPFYNYLIYGWSVEVLSRLKGFRGVAAALVSLLMILFFHLFVG
jgi:hypothetical protein